jgi:predicted TIM-barrel fold metal-dependent hydrolase
MDRFSVEKAIITTINRMKFNTKDDREVASDAADKNAMNSIERFKELMPKGQISHQDVIDIAKKAPNRFYKFFWFNPKITPETEIESNYQILKDHFKKGFVGVKVHSAFNFLKIPKDILQMVTFMHEYDKNLILFIHSMPKTSFFSGVSSKDIANLAKRFPKLRIIVGHAAYAMEYSMDNVFLLKNYKNVFFETSCSVSFGIYNIIKAVGHNRVLFGSDSPTASPLPLEIAKITTLPRISKVQKQDILYNNVSDLLSNSV